MWYFGSVMPIKLDLTVGGWDNVGQLILASLVGLFAIAAGVAIDIGLVRIATGVPTHSNRFLSLTFLVPVVFCTATCIITFDHYSRQTWEPKLSTLTHLAYPIASFFAALYWSWSRDWVQEITASIIAEKESLAIQLEVWIERFNARVAEATDHLTTEVQRLTTDLAVALETTQQHDRIAKESIDRLTAKYEEIQLAAGRQRVRDADDIGKLKSEVEDAKSQAESIIKQLRDQLVANQIQGQREIDRLNGVINDLKSDQLIPQVAYQYPTMKDAIEAQDLTLTNAELIARLNVPEDQVTTFNTQVSQARKKMRETSQMAA
jgi:predicted Zn-dependent protease with MMP-like domain